MSLVLPDLRSTASRNFIACGKLADSNLKLPEEFIIAKITRARKPLFVRLITGGKKSQNHFHLEVAVPDAFPPKRPPKITGTFEAIEDVYSKLVGKIIDVDFRCDFIRLKSGLPESGVIQTLSKEISAAGAAMRLTRGTMKIKGSPISEVSWHLLNEEHVRLVLDSERRITLFDGYLVEAHKTMSKLLDVLVSNNECAFN